MSAVLAGQQPVTCYLEGPYIVVAMPSAAAAAVDAAVQDCIEIRAQAVADIVCARRMLLSAAVCAVYAGQRGPCVQECLRNPRGLWIELGPRPAIQHVARIRCKGQGTHLVHCLLACDKCGAACSQVEEREAQGVHVPIRMALPGSDRLLWTQRLLAITGTRFVNEMALQSRAFTDVTLHAVAGKRRRSDDGAPSQGQAVEQASDALQADTSSSDMQPSSAGLSILADMISGATPQGISLTGLVHVTAAAKFCMADCILQALPECVAPLMATANHDDVRLLRPLLLPR
jgi:hypothetical protein